MEHAAGETADISDTEDRSGHGHGQHGDDLDKAFCFEFTLYHQIRDDHGKQGRNRRGDQGQDKGILEGLEALVAGEDLLKPAGGQREVAAPGAEQRAEGYTDIHHHHEERDR